MTENFQSPEDAEIFEAAAERGAHTPLDDAPELDSEAQWYLKAFNLLSSGRPVGLTAGPLPLSDILYHWSSYARIGPLDDFVEIIKGLDRVFIEANRPETRG